MKRFAPFLVAAMVVFACRLPGGISLGQAPSSPTTEVRTSTPSSVPSDTPIPPTAVPPSPTPLPPVIGAGTIAGLSDYLDFGQGEVLRTVAFSPDGTILASAAGNSEDFAIRLWDIGTGQSLRALIGHTSIVWAVAFSPDGRLLASASGDGTARVWDWHTGSLLKSLDFPNQAVSVTFSPDGQTLAVGGAEAWPNAAIRTWSVDTWEPQMKLAEFWDIPATAYTRDGQYLVGGGTSRNVRVWRTSDGEALHILYHSGQVSSVAISPDGSTVATGLCVASLGNGGCTRGAVWLWDLQAGTLAKKLADFPDAVRGVAYSADGSVVIAGSRDGTLRAYATSDFDPLWVANSPGGVEAMALSPDGRLLATGGARGEIHLWRVEP